jgi:hypothetical protein
VGSLGLILGEGLMSLRIAGAPQRLNEQSPLMSRTPHREGCGGEVATSVIARLAAREQIAFPVATARDAADHVIYRQRRQR